MHSMFYAYVGGVLKSSGPDAVNSWIHGLLSQENLIQPENVVTVDPRLAVAKPPQKRVKSETLSPPPQFFSMQPARPPPARLPPAPARPNPLTPAQPDTAFLPLFNQEASKRRVTVEYLAEFSGKSHAGRWTVKCIGEPFS